MQKFVPNISEGGVIKMTEQEQQLNEELKVTLEIVNRILELLENK